MEWNKLMQHCERYKEKQKILNGYKPQQRKNYQPQHRIPNWVQIKQYEPKLENWGNYKQLLKGKKIGLMG